MVRLLQLHQVGGGNRGLVMVEMEQSSGSRFVWNIDQNVMADFSVPCGERKID